MSFFTVSADISALISNYLDLRNTVGELCCVVKCDAYGHGLIDCVSALYSTGCRSFAVASSAEAFSVRRLAPDAEILLLSRAEIPLAGAFERQNITLTVFSGEYAEALKSTGTKPKLHLKLDSRMNRSGFRYEDVPSDLYGLSTIVTGVYTHFPRAYDTQETAGLARQFADTARELEKRLGRTLKKHCAASLAALTLPESRMDLCRIGLALYGVLPPELNRDGDSRNRSFSPELPSLMPVMTVKSRVIGLHKARAGEYVGYGNSFLCHSDVIVATVSGGYADGIPRSCKNRLTVLINGSPAVICGIPCMDRTMFDVTRIFESGKKIDIGDEVLFFGRERGVTLMADAAGTIPYEILTGFRRFRNTERG